MMKKIYLILVLIIYSCKRSPNETYGDWRAIHIFHKGNAILDNNFKENKWSVQLYKTKVFYIDRASNQWVLYLDDDDEPVRGDFRVLKTSDSLDFEIYNATDKRFDGIYNRNIETDTVEQAFKNVIYYLTLKSKDTKIMAVKAKRLASNKSR